GAGCGKQHDWRFGCQLLWRISKSDDKSGCCCWYTKECKWLHGVMAVINTHKWGVFLPACSLYRLIMPVPHVLMLSDIHIKKQHFVPDHHLHPSRSIPEKYNIYDPSIRSTQTIPQHSSRFPKTSNIGSNSPQKSLSHPQPFSRIALGPMFVPNVKRK